MSVSSSALERLGGGALFDALRAAADRGKLGIALAFLDREPPQTLLLNDYPTALLGYAASDVEREGLWLFFAEEEVASLRERLSRRGHGESQPTSFETVAKSKQGKRVPIEITLSDIELDGRRATVAFFRDVSERWRAIGALQESEERFRLVVEGAPDGVVILHGQRIHFLNPRAARLLGLPNPDAGRGRIVTEFLHPDDVGRAAQRIRRLFETGERHREPAEYRSKSIDGEELVVEISSLPIELGGERAVLAFARDITERKAIQKRLAEAERLTALGVLSAGVAHEINNPLAYVLLNLEYLRRELPRLAQAPWLLDEMMVRVRDACHGAERVASIVRDLRTFSRSDDSARGPVELREVLEAAINIAGSTLKQSARLVRDYRPTPLVEGNSNRLEQVFLNLLLNAAQAFPAAGRDQNEIRIRLFEDAGRAVVEIEDTGEGIPEELMARIFEPFFTTKPVGVGTGLGLPICRSIVAAHGGSIAVDSRRGRGTIFRVELAPSRSDSVRAASEAARAANGEDSRGPRGRVLIVDDEMAVASTLKLVLERDHEVELATSAKDALVLLARQRFDAIICDLMMPAMNGMELYEVVRSAHPGLEERIVFMTGGAMLARADSFLGKIQTPLLEKPFDIELVRKTLDRLVAASRRAP